MFYIGDDFKVGLRLNESLVGATVTMEYTTPSGATGESAATVDADNNIAYMDIDKTDNNTVGDWIIRYRGYRDWETDRKSTRLNSSHRSLSRMPSSA